MLESEEFDEEYELERILRHKKLKDAIKQAFEENKEPLKGSEND